MRAHLTLIAAVLIAGAVFAATTIPASAGSPSGSLDATVTVASPCIQLDRTSVDFGHVGLSSNGAPTTATVAAQITNCGGQAEDVSARGSDATDGAGSHLWMLMSNGGFNNPCSLGADRFFLWSAIDGYANPNATSSLQSGSDILIASSVAGGPSPTLRATITMPCSGSVGIGSVAHFSLTYTATY